MLKKGIVIDRWSRDLFVRPAIENRYQDVLDSPPESRLRTGVITHPCGNFGKWFRHNWPKELVRPEKKTRRHVSLRAAGLKALL